MHKTEKKTDNSHKSLLVTIMAWGALIIYSTSSFYAINRAFKDLAILKNNDMSLLILFSAATLLFIIVLIPVVFAIGLIMRKNWGRLGIMTISLISAAITFSFLTFIKALYPRQFLWILFSLSLFVMLRSERIKRESVLTSNEA